MFGAYVEHKEMFGAYVEYKEKLWFLRLLWREIIAGYQMRRMNTGVHSRDLTDERGGKYPGEPKSQLRESF